MTTKPTARQRHIAHLHLHAALSEAQYADVIELMSGVTPHVQAVPPDAVQLDLTSALRYFDLSPYDAVQLVKMRLKGFYGIDRQCRTRGQPHAGGDGGRRVRAGRHHLDPRRAGRRLAASPPGHRAARDRARDSGNAQPIRPDTIGQVVDLPGGTLQRLSARAPPGC